LRRAMLQEGVRRVEDFARRHRFAELAWPGEGASFLNVNTPEDLMQAEAELARDRRAPARSPGRR
jgi:molybdopterin-guanine dinucleotide biosynthesis protein A